MQVGRCRTRLKCTILFSLGVIVILASSAPGPSAPSTSVGHSSRRPPSMSAGTWEEWARMRPHQRTRLVLCGARQKGTPLVAAGLYKAGGLLVVREAACLRCGLMPAVFMMAAACNRMPSIGGLRSIRCSLLRASGDVRLSLWPACVCRDTHAEPPRPPHLHIQHVSLVGPHVPAAGSRRHDALECVILRDGWEAAAGAAAREGLTTH
jgi:hypothetical protein